MAVELVTRLCDFDRSALFGHESLPPRLAEMIIFLLHFPVSDSMPPVLILPHTKPQVGLASIPRRSSSSSAIDAWRSIQYLDSLETR